MGKVYDALRRAEAERSRQAAVSPGAPPAAQWEAQTAGTAPQRTSWLARLRRFGRRSPVEDASAINKRRIALLQPDSIVTEQFRTLRARLDSLAAERPIRTVALTSALAGEGKTLAAINLAIVTAMGVGRRVLLVDCDLRKPRVQQALGLRPEAGLAEVLADRVPFEEARLKVEGVNLEVLAVRERPANPSELLASPRMRDLVEEVAGQYDRVIFDTPPTLAVPDAKTVSELSDGVVLVVRAGSTPREEIEAALDVLDRRRVLGLVFNGAAAEADRYRY